ncbi:unnamed protein product [Mytilus edulis]|uniref:Uncharacterized protein n=1 Tax=Mytilus edulis TaxID=6550 RepID=A0A8S3TMV4_MYTED|nr:unnamed protein product [Mytilus edulis]
MADSPDPEIQFHAPPPEFGQGDDQNEHDDHEYGERRYSRAFENGDTIIVHRPCLKHRNADALSRNPCASCSRQESVKNAHDSCDEDSRKKKEQLSFRTVTRSRADTSPTRNQFVLLGWDVNTIRQQQLQDKIIGQLFIKFEDKETKPEWNSLSDESSDLKTLWNMWDRSSVHSTTEFTPNFLTFGREVTLPLQAVIPMPSPAQYYATCKEDFVIDLQNKLQFMN